MSSTALFFDSPPPQPLPLSLGVELEYTAIVTLNPLHPYSLSPIHGPIRDRFHLRVLNLVAAVLRTGLKSAGLEVDIPPWPVVVVPTDGSRLTAYVENQRLKGNLDFPANYAETTWIVKKETMLTMDSREGIGIVEGFGLEITSPPFLDASTRKTWDLVLCYVLPVLESLNTKHRYGPEGQEATECAVLDENELTTLCAPPEDFPEDAQLVVRLSASWRAGILVHVGTGVGVGQTPFGGNMIKHAVLLYVAHEKEIDGFHFLHRDRGYAIQYLRTEFLEDGDLRNIEHIYNNTTCTPRFNKLWKLNAPSSYDTIEFRQLGSTFEEEYMIAWCNFILQFCRGAALASAEEVKDALRGRRNLHELVGCDVIRTLKAARRHSEELTNAGQ